MKSMNDSSRLGPRRGSYGVAVLVALGAFLPLAACGDDDAPAATTTGAGAGGPGSSSSSSGAGASSSSSANGGGGSAPAEVYEFDSRFSPGESAVAYDGQIFRQVLIQATSNYIGGLTAELDGVGGFKPEEVSEVVLALEYYYDFDDSTSAED